MNKNNGRIKKGEHRSPATEFKKGEHWREEKPYWDKAWFEREYIDKQRSLADMAQEFGVRTTAIAYWANKHNIKTRTTAEVRKIKHWGLKGEKNGMYGKRGAEVPNWKGGITPDRQAFYVSEEWKSARAAVYGRDKETCQRCGISKRKSQMHVHHIASFEVVDLRADVDNLILLCKKCHNWVHSKKNTKQEFIREEVLND